MTIFIVTIGDNVALLDLTEKIMNQYFAIIPRTLPPVQHINTAKLIAHRGAHNNAQGVFENTHKAFRLAKEVGCWGIEFDVHATADNILVVNHDPTLTRLWGHNVAITDLSFNELRALEPGVPSLAEVVEEYGNSMHLFIELKVPFHDEQKLLETLGSLEPCRDYHVLALNPAILSSFAQIPRKALLLVALHNNVSEFCKISIQENYGGVMGSYLLLTDNKIRQLEEANQVYGVGFVDSKNSLYRELNRGINWIFTNEAVVVSHYFNELKNTRQ